MPEREFEKEFFNIANFLYKLANDQSPSSLPPTEILLRTYTNRVYYYMYHSTRKETLQKIQNSEIKDRAENWGIKIENLFREHKLLREFYEYLGDPKKQVGLKKAEDIAETLNIYNTYRVLADYHIERSAPRLGRKKVDFTLADHNSNAWKLLDPTYVEGKITKLLEDISNLFDEIDAKGHSYDAAMILNMMTFGQY